MNRREFVKKTALVGVAGICLAGSLDGMTAADPQPELIVAQGGEPEELLKAALTAFGGLGKLVKPGMTVMVKANFSWYGPPEKACDTNPDLLAALVKVCLKAGARRVRVVDLAIDPSGMCLESSGIAKAVKAAGGEVQDLNPYQSNTRYVKRTAGILNDLYVCAEALESQCLIDVPILKHHGITTMTGALKSLMGLTPERPRMHSLGIDQAIVDLNKIIKPHLHLIDAYRVLKSGGPQGVPGAVVAMPKQLILAHDPVAADAYGASLLGLEPTYLKMATEADLGCADLSKIKITKVDAKTD